MQHEREWAKLKKKYRRLPDWKWLKANFHIKVEDGNLIESVRVSVSDKLDQVAHEMIEPIIGSNENYCCYFERKMLSEAERDKMFEIYRQLLALLWQSNRLAVDFSDKGFADWLTKICADWERLKPAITKMFDKLATGWQNYKKQTEETAYHG
jgi:hypothetical protein